MRKLSGVLICLLILTSSFIIPLSFIIPVFPVDEKEVAEVKSNTKWRLLGHTPIEDIKNKSTLKYSDFKLNFSYGDYYIVFEPYVIYNGNYFSLEDIIGIFPNIRQNVKISRPSFSWKYTLKISDIPLNLQPNIDYIGFKRVDTNLKWSDVEVKTSGYWLDGDINDFIEIKYIVVKNKVRLDYIDLIDSGFSVDANKTDILIGNIQQNIVNNSLTLDPTIKLQDANTENLDDTFVESFFPGANSGNHFDLHVSNSTLQTERAYLKFNLTQITNDPLFNQITSATLYLNHTLRAGAGDKNITTHYVNNTVWDEVAITWNNQPCGSTVSSLNASCNSSPSDWELVDQAGGLFRWFSWDVTSIVQLYNTSDDYVSIGVFTDIEGDITNFIGKYFASKEWPAPNLDDRPYLNVTYSLSVFITGIFLTGISSMAANSTNLLNNTATSWTNETIAVFNVNVSSNFQFWRYELPESEDNHTHFVTYTRTITANYTITAYALSAGGDGVAGVSMLLFAIIGGFAVIVLIVASRKR